MNRGLNRGPFWPVDRRTCSQRRRICISWIAPWIASPPFPIANNERDRIASGSRDPTNGIARASLLGA
eukprot:12391771-Alexandrium_andersonii.AAC.1